VAGNGGGAIDACDDRSGLYTGGALIAHDPEGRSARLLGHTEYLGYAVRAGFQVGPSDFV